MEEEKKEQTVLYDDFEKSLQHEGIEIVVPKEEKDNPQGVGAGSFTPRKTAPSESNPYYLKLGRGGYNRCILIQGNSCLPNCVGFAFGRFLEECGRTACSQLPTCNAEDWLSVARQNGLPTGELPKIGAVIVWASGNLWNGKDGCGHVGVVEEIYSDGSILVSQSNYGGTRFFLTTIKKPYGIYGQRFLGFIYNPYLVHDPRWVKDEKGWWYDNGDGTYAKGWKKINDKWYFFKENGYMVTGWLKDKGDWYYLTDSGAMATGWVKVKEKWYYLDSTGRMVTGWIHYKNNWYYCDGSGAMLTGEHTLKVYFNKDGALSRR